MLGDPPLVKLANMVLLSALAKGAQTIAIRRDTAEECVVMFSIAGASHEELRPPLSLLGPLVRRLSVLANLPSYLKGQGATGFIHLIIGSDREAWFAIRVEGHGDGLTARLRILGPHEVPPGPTPV